MNNNKRVIFICILSIVFGLYIFIVCVTTKPIYKTNQYMMTSYSFEGIYKVEGNGIVVTNNKYNIKNAKVRVNIYDENGFQIMSKEYDYYNNHVVEYYFEFTNSVPKTVEYEVIEAKIDNKLDLYISLIFVCISSVTLFKTYIEKKFSIK